MKNYIFDLKIVETISHILLVEQKHKIPDIWDYKCPIDIFSRKVLIVKNVTCIILILKLFPFQEKQSLSYAELLELTLKKTFYIELSRHNYTSVFRWILWPNKKTYKMFFYQCIRMHFLLLIFLIGWTI